MINYIIISDCVFFSVQYVFSNIIFILFCFFFALLLSVIFKPAFFNLILK